MENKINIAEILKDCPTGMELNCVTTENVYFDKVFDGVNSIYPIRCYILEYGVKHPYYFTKYGEFNTMGTAKCVIFPKGKTTWEGFVPPCKFKDGDILSTTLGGVFLFKYTFLNTSDWYECYVGISGTGSFHINGHFAYKEYCRFATEEEKQKLFDAIKANGYRWNPETNILEKLPKFKIGDKIILKYNPHNIPSVKIKAITKSQYILEENGYLYIDITDEKFVLEDKFNITILKPFDKVLVRTCSLDKWRIQFFEKYDKACKPPFICIGHNKYKQCIPYENNKHLLDTTDNCDDYYKTW